IGYYKFKIFSEKVLRKNDYSKLILLTGNTAVTISRVILEKYKGKYILDIRDYFKENKKWYYNIQEKLILNSYNTVISSEGFKRFLPEYNYTLAHNIIDLDLKVIDEFRSRKRTKNAQIL